MISQIIVESSALLMVSADVLPGMEVEFNHWYDDHHIPQYSGKMPFLKSVKRFYAKNSKPNYIAIYEFASYDDLKRSMNSDESKLAREDADKQIGILVRSFTFSMYSQTFPKSH